MNYYNKLCPKNQVISKNHWNCTNPHLKFCCEVFVFWFIFDIYSLTQDITSLEIKGKKAKVVKDKSLKPVKEKTKKVLIDFENDDVILHETLGGGGRYFSS